MSHASLATRHRPQAFAEVTGQAMIKTILSRAAARDNVAPAYLFSGTRGVGKTTLARIFAKALNCVNAPTGEPCNVCDQCRRITQGNHVDVVEIDGASNTGVDDARRLKETIGYAPMEGRYKVFIIDEAHMLSRNAFNALLKTLEEPPPRAIFILATTEPHKFPATIVSRCQHFVFQSQPESELVEHLRQILEKEGVAYEPGALRLIARRAAGSVRDSMSLMGQTLALGGDVLDEAVTRQVLGVAGQEVFERLLEAVRAEDCAAIVVLTRELLERGIDIGFFLRELATLWRNLFLIRQAGEAAALALDLPEDERKRLVALAPKFELAFIHAAWHMVLESQRQILTSLEPAAALELLLLNLALLPRLVSLETLSRAAGRLPDPAAGKTHGSPAAGPGPEGAVPGRGTPSHAAGQEEGGGGSGKDRDRPSTGQPEPEARPAGPDTTEVASAGGQAAAASAEPARHDNGQGIGPEAEQAAGQAARMNEHPMPEADTVPDEPQPDPGAVARGVADLSWDGFLAFCAGPGAAADGRNASVLVRQLGQARGTFADDGLTIVTVAATQQAQLSAPAGDKLLHGLAAAYAGRPLAVRVLPPDRPVLTEADLKQSAAAHPQVQAMIQTFDAQIVRCTPAENPDGDPDGDDTA